MAEASRRCKGSSRGRREHEAPERVSRVFAEPRRLHGPTRRGPSWQHDDGQAASEIRCKPKQKSARQVARRDRCHQRPQAARTHPASLSTSALVTTFQSGGTQRGPAGTFHFVVKSGKCRPAAILTAKKGIWRREGDGTPMIKNCKLQNENFQSQIVIFQFAISPPPFSSRFRGQMT